MSQQIKQINGRWYKEAAPYYVDLYGLSQPFDDAIAYLRDCAENIHYPQLRYEDGWGDGPSELTVTGYTPATQAEITRHQTKLAKDRERAEKKRKQEREKKRLARERADAEALERVKKKFPELLK